MRDRLKQSAMSVSTTQRMRFQDSSTHLERIVCRASRAKPKRTLEHVRLEDRLDDRLRRHLHSAIADRRDRQRTQLFAPELRDEGRALDAFSDF